MTAYALLIGREYKPLNPFTIPRTCSASVKGGVAA